jgi:DNA (cytosine-5)-methyltransferase 1
MLITWGLIPQGEVDERSIEDVEAKDLEGYRRCHFFAGIGGWPLALQIAGYSDEHVWTGSCPCQPFSCAGKRRGESDERHLWPEFRRLIEECRPATVFGEQVASADGRRWFSGVRLDLETLGYGVGAADLCTASVSAPHIRQRLYWVADAAVLRRQPKQMQEPARIQRKMEREAERRKQPYDNGTTTGSSFWSNSAAIPCRDGKWRRVPRMGDPYGARRGEQCRAESMGAEFKAAERGGVPCRVAYNNSVGREKLEKRNGEPEESGHEKRREDIDRGGGKNRSRFEPRFESLFQRVADGLSDGMDLGRIACAFPLSEKIDGRAMLLKGYGNAIVPQLAAEFIGAAMEAME